jgi:hypothetical protein
MSHTKVIERKERLMDQLAKGYRTRYIRAVPLIVANDRASNVDPGDVTADAIGGIAGESAYVAIMIAPCNCQVLRASINADQMPTGAGTQVVTLYKAATVDVSLATGSLKQTDKVCYDLTLSVVSGALDLVEGQLVYALVAMQAVAVAAKSIGMVIQVEYMPTEA